MKIIKSLVLVSFVFIIASCSTIPPMDFMVEEVGVVNNRKDAELKSLTVGFAPQSQQRKMEGNETVPPIWKEALQDALARSLIFKDDAVMKVNISVRIVELDAPGAGVDMKAKVAAIYEIVDRSNGDLVFAQEISSEGIVPFSYDFLGAVRAQEAANRSVRNNIAEFINQLEQADFSKPMFTGKQ